MMVEAANSERFFSEEVFACVLRAGRPGCSRCPQLRRGADGAGHHRPQSRRVVDDARGDHTRAARMGSGRVLSAIAN